MLPGESILSGASGTCKECKKKLVPEVLKSAAGFYVGTRCDCGPYSRESEYFASREIAEKALPIYKIAVAGLITVVPIPKARTTAFNPGKLRIEVLDNDLEPTGEVI